MLRTQLLFALLAFVLLGLSPVIKGDELVSYRQKRLILSRPVINRLDEERYPFCRVGNTTGACLNNLMCSSERGIFMGYCPEGDGVCCHVVKTCDQSSSSHNVLFRNPGYPERETDSRVCVLTLKVGRGICAMRMDNEFFELRKYDDDYCPSDTLTILGSKNVTTPLCGNMTGWQTTFEVKEMSDVKFAMVVQGSPSYKFSILISMLPCHDIHIMNSPLNAGLRNVDAVKYTTTTTTTTEEPPETTTDSTDVTDTTVIPEESDAATELPKEDSEEATESTENEPTATFIPPVRSVGASDSSTTKNPIKVSTLPTATIKFGSEKPDVNFWDTQKENDEISYKEEEPGNLVTGYYDPTPTSSIFSRIFATRTGYSQCSQGYNKDSGVENVKNGFNYAEPGSNKEKCFRYDTVEGAYKVNENCATTEQTDYETPSFRVVGGHYANLNEYPWQVALIYKKKFFCGGALISDRHILTASHCAFGSYSSGINNIIVDLGDHDLMTKKDTENQAIRVRRVIWNLHFSPDTTLNDIAIFELEKPVNFTYQVSPVKLPTDLDNYYVNQRVIVTGWGRESLKTKKTATILREYESTVHSIANCVTKWKSYPGIEAVKEMHICMNVTTGTPCHGDSGGPLVSCIEDQCTIVGVCSFGFPLCRNVGLPAVFSRVTYFKKWIDINTTPISYHDIG